MMRTQRLLPVQNHFLVSLDGVIRLVQVIQHVGQLECRQHVIRIGRGVALAVILVGPQIHVAGSGLVAGVRELAGKVHHQLAGFFGLLAMRR